MKKIVINKCHGGFGISQAVKDMVPEFAEIFDREIARDDPRLVNAVEILGDEASGAYARLAVVVIPDDVDWEIEEYDGWEWVAEKHATWG